MSESQEKPFLSVHEWLAVVFIISLMAMLTFLSLSRTVKVETENPHFVTDPFLEVVVEGEVDRPGTHRIEKGATVADVLKLVGVKKEADTRKLKLEAKLRRKQHIKVPMLPMITVKVEGAVLEPKEIRMLKGSRLEDLIAQIAFQEEADIEFLRRKRRLKDGEVIIVPDHKN